MSHLVLKPKHTLIGKSLLPMILKFKSADDIDPENLARLKSTYPLTKYSVDELAAEFVKITGDELKNVMLLAEMEKHLDGMRNQQHADKVDEALKHVKVLASRPKLTSACVLLASLEVLVDCALKAGHNETEYYSKVLQACRHYEDNPDGGSVKKLRFHPDIPDWEKGSGFNPMGSYVIYKLQEHWVNYRGKIPCGIPRIWKPASPCGSCSYPNDDDAKFCQSCGNYLEIQSDEPVDLIDIMVNERIRHLDIMMENTPYCKKVSALEKEFSDFLSKNAKSIVFATPEEVRKFLIVKDCKGKTQVHEIICPNLGKSGIFDCPCPLRLASSTVRTMLGQLKRIFENYGKGRSWDEGSNLGNPIASKKVQRYLEAITREQAISHRVVKQAKPLFFDKLRKIAILIDSKIVKGNTTPEKFILLRDQAFLKLQFFAGDRASDLGKCLSQEIRRLRDDSGFVITHTVGKTLSNGKKNEFSVMRLDDHSVCPVFGIEKYVSGAGEMGINLTLGYLFRILDCSRKRVLEAPVSHSVMYGRLKSYLRELGMDEGETPHGIRGGCAVTLAVSGFGNSQDIMDHVGWFSRGSLDRYSRLGKMADKSTVGNLFKQVSDNPSYASSVYDKYGDTSKLPTAF
ncbi:Hypothetical predicted protein [Mytilus galloprovincialis]|uniref:ALOG domain-containing protein n=1 Tax=Mytilus galloprovincialis TaxID=29158 RepID=A0A8B6GTV1_MYTGA|nr:Hypothetical predicted protein [Mytilus galloprovincialis]